MKTLFLFFLLLVGIQAYGQTSIFLNVTNYGAVGDAVQFYANTTSNSVVVTTTNRLTSSIIGDAIEIFQVGPQTYGKNSYGTNAYGNQDLIAVITNIVYGTNIYLSLPAQNTLVNAFATYGHNNQINFLNAIADAGTNAVINIPAGKYLFLTTTNSNPNVYGHSCIVLNRGGITFNGAGTGNTTLLAQGAWTLQKGNPCRGFLIEENPPIMNNFPVVFANMTLDGGVQNGNTPIHGIQANPVDGLGWDLTHDAFLVASVKYANANALNQMLWTNLVFTHWRGEMAKSIEQSTNGNLNIFNCAFIDGNATAINIYPSINISNCIFSQLFQVAEYYQAYSTNTCFFQNNLVTNIIGNGFALNGGKGNNPSFIITGNTFYLPGNGYNGIETVPADNVVISSNIFICKDYANVIVLGCAGYQGTFDNSNIVISANIVTNPSVFVEIGGGSTSSDIHRVENVSISGNILRNPNHAVTLLQTYGWTTNIVLYSNDCSQLIPLMSVTANSGVNGAQYALIDTNNIYYTYAYDLNGVTNSLSYKAGSRYEVVYSYHVNTIYNLTDTDSNQVPTGAQMLINNNNSSKAPIPIFLNSALTMGPVSLPYGQTFVANWKNGTWVNAANNANTVAPTISAIMANASNLGTNSAVLQIPWGITVQLSAKASTIIGNNLIWQWSYSVNGGPQIVSQNGSGAEPVSNFTYSADTGGNTYAWTLRVADTTTGLSTQSKFIVFVQLQPPQGVFVVPN